MVWDFFSGGAGWLGYGRGWLWKKRFFSFQKKYYFCTMKSCNDISQVADGKCSDGGLMGENGQRRREGRVRRLNIIATTLIFTNIALFAGFGMYALLATVAFFDGLMPVFIGVMFLTPVILSILSVRTKRNTWGTVLIVFSILTLIIFGIWKSLKKYLEFCLQ